MTASTLTAMDAPAISSPMRRGEVRLMAQRLLHEAVKDDGRGERDDDGDHDERRAADRARWRARRSPTGQWTRYSE